MLNRSQASLINLKVFFEVEVFGSQNLQAIEFLLIRN